MEEELKPREIVEKFECQIFGVEQWTPEAVSIKSAKCSFEIDNFSEEKSEQIGLTNSNVHVKSYRESIDSLIKSQENELFEAVGTKRTKLENNIQLLKGVLMSWGFY